MSEPRVQHLFMPFEGSLPGTSSLLPESPSATPPASSDPSDLLRLIAEANVHGYVSGASPKTQLERLLGTASMSDINDQYTQGIDVNAFGLPPELSSFNDYPGMAALRNSSKTLKCPKCNWHYKYQETLEIHMKEKHSDGEVKCPFCVENRPHPKLARGESYSCGYKPYRCELCKYSTTTKGNLSIHMQSDKHLHAMQDLPTNIALSCPPSSGSPVQEGEKTYVCLVCGCYSGDNLQEIMHHAEKDRSRPSQADVSINGGLFRCHLCPYNTNLKANFQLHTRTDKHLQRVQMVNHIREGATTTSALCRLNTAKSHFQVLCRPCQEILNSSSSLREHCDSVGHRTNLRQPLIQYSCRLCAYETQSKSEAIGHMTCHEPASWPRDKIDFDALAGMDDDAAYACASCGFTAKEASLLEEHARTHEEGEPCPLCDTRTATLTDHLIEEHKIASSAVDKLLQVHRIEPIGPPPGSVNSFRCGQCPMAFRSEASLHSHSIIHLFSQSQKCLHCAMTFKTADELKNHTDTEHPSCSSGLPSASSSTSDDSRCDLCAESFPSKSALVAHFNSVRHLHRAKKQLEQGTVDLSAQVLSALQNPSSPGEKKPFRCNICKIGYGQGATLDIHLRSVAHQSRMSKLAELVSTGEVDAAKPATEQPLTPPSTTIGDLLNGSGDDESANAAAPNMMTMFNIMNMLMGQNAQLGQTMANSQTNSIGDETTPDETDPVCSPSTPAQLIESLKSFGLEKLAAVCPEVVSRIPQIAMVPDDQIALLSRVDCGECGERLPSLMALSNHCREVHNTAAVPDSTLRLFCQRILQLKNFASGMDDGSSAPSPISRTMSRDESEPPEKRAREGPTPPEPTKPDLAQMAMLSMMGGFPFLPGNNPMAGFLPQGMHELFNPLMQQQLQMQLAAAGQSPAKRARTRISDDQLKILRQYFDINNSPTESQIKEMSMKAGLPEKVIKHWFRNTLFKERQRDKDSPYNFSVPPQMSIDLDTYEKTGEAKVVSVASEPRRDPSSIAPVAAPTVKEEKAASPTSNAMNLQAMMQQMQAAANPFQFMEHGLMHGQLPQLPSQSTPSGRRANRTRFTDYQLRTLQQFFDKQAYPKDDDLEILSKKLQLSPRVIVVWFQNARQKARKIYENQPNHENSDRFVRTPGCNFQCKRCNLVFQRYYELIQHQQKICYKDDGLAQANDNKGVEETLTEEEKAHLCSSIQPPAPPTLPQIPTTLGMETKPTDLLKLLGGGKSSTEALLKMCESANATTPSSSAPTAAPSVSFHKRCPFCALLFKSKQSMSEHLSTRHSHQILFSPVDIDSLPHADDVPVISMSNFVDNRDMCGVLDLSSAGQDRESLSMSPFLGQPDGDEGADQDGGDLPFAALLSAGQQPGAARSPVNNKRYRTHLTPVQVYVMKCVFCEYKTPSMSECESLGRDIGLHKRVVQVWFQNARAKERKHRATNGEPEELFRSTATGCEPCGVEYSGRNTMQDHLFSAPHLSMLKTQMKNDPSVSVEMEEVRPNQSISREPAGNGNKINNGNKVKLSTTSSSSSQLGSIAAMRGFPFNLMNGMVSPAGLPLMFDQSMFGVPVSMLQIPDTVKQQIKLDMTQGLTSTRFTHDGATVSSLRDQLSAEDRELLKEDDVEVGWGCPSCVNVFQQEALLKAHQRQICTTAVSFTLVQTHYGCSACASKYGSQAEFQSHCSSQDHQQKRAAALETQNFKD